MSDEILSYIEMCQREGLSLQKGMNFQANSTHSVILLSVRPNAPYRDRFEDNGTTLIYEGHDWPRGAEVPDPKQIDQPSRLPSGGLTENGKFEEAALAAKRAEIRPRQVRAYEKIKPGIWSYAGMFELVDVWQESDGARSVFKFKLVVLPDISSGGDLPTSERVSSRIIPTPVKLEVWKRDKGQCVTCGATDELHFDHIIPYSRGGTSLKADNIQLLCARHNLAKHDRIE